jgi:DNA-directed RNA polymerase specialized sigma24 family protein
MSVKPSLKREKEISQEMFDYFLAWLNPDPDLAGRKYEEIRRRLIMVFTCRGCTIPEELADETINRVIRRAGEIAPSYVGDPALYFYGVAHYVHHEYCRKKPEPMPPPKVEDPPYNEQRHTCLEKCMNQLPERSRELVLRYYQEEKHAKIDLRKQLAEKLGIPINALRIRAHRIRLILEECVSSCVQQGSTA